jgi:hypothetical protein
MDSTQSTADQRLAFTAEEFGRVLLWAYDGLLTSPSTKACDRDLYERIGQMLGMPGDSKAGDSKAGCQMCGAHADDPCNCFDPQQERP